MSTPDLQAAAAKSQMSTQHAVGHASSTAPGKGRFYDAGLDLLRFFAFLMVFSLHAHKLHVSHLVEGLFKIGKYGVGVFFVLSAYLITELLLRESEKTGTISLSKFYLRRLLRIWPLYFLVLFIGIIFGLFSPNYHVSLGKALSFSFLLGNVYAARYGLGAAIIYPLWTLSIEEQFYTVIPAIAKRGGAKLLAGASVALIVLAYAMLIYFGRSQHVEGQNELVSFNSFVQFQFFAAGTLLALVLHGRTWKPSFAARAGIFAASMAGLAFCIGALLMESPQPRTTPILLAGNALRLLSTLGLFLAFLNIGVDELGSMKRLTYFGKISYGLYVYHVLVITLFFGKRNPLSSFFETHFLIADIGVLLVTILIAAASFRWFEQPILRLKAKFEVVKTGLPELQEPATGAGKSISSAA